jgi:hypothetical protein
MHGSALILEAGSSIREKKLDLNPHPQNRQNRQNSGARNRAVDGRGPHNEGSRTLRLEPCSSPVFAD